MAPCSAGGSGGARRAAAAADERPPVCDPPQQPGGIDRGGAVDAAVVPLVARLLDQAQHGGERSDDLVAAALRLRHRRNRAIELGDDGEERAQDVAEAADDLPARIIGLNDLKDSQQNRRAEQSAEEAPQRLVNVDHRPVGDHDDHERVRDLLAEISETRGVPTAI